jgi:hypothetical protein
VQLKITVDRYLSDDDATLSRVSIDGALECYGLEDEYRAEKVANETRIPAGEYDIMLRPEGGMHNKYCEADWCKDWHKGMLWLQNVPEFTWIYIHPGNTDDHTSGCLLVGERVNDTPELSIGRSRAAYESLYKKVVDAAWAADLTIEYIDNDRSA